MLKEQKELERGKNNINTNSKTGNDKQIGALEVVFDMLGWRKKKKKTFRPSTIKGLWSWPQLAGTNAWLNYVEFSIYWMSQDIGLSLGQCCLI